jgi:hypothetical protein
MKTVKREKLLALALMFGLVSPAARAEFTVGGYKFFAPATVEVEKASAPVVAKPAEPEPTKPTEESVPPAYVNLKSGLNDSELREIVSDLEINKEGDVIGFAGLVPASCATDARVDYAFKDKVHAITISLPKCDGKYVARAGEPMVALSSILKKIKLKDESGKLVLRHYKAGDAASKSRVQDEDLKGDDGKLITHKGSAEIEAEKLASAKKDEAKKKIEQLEDLEKKIDKFCKSEDIDSLSAELLKAKDLLGDVSSLIEKKQNDKLAKFKRELANADSVEKANELLESYKALANELGLDEEGAKEAYISKRFELMKASVDAYKTGEKTSREADSDIRTWAADLRTTDSSVYRKRKSEFGVAYAEVGTSAANAEKYDEAVDMYGKGKKYVDGKQNAQLDGQISKVYMEQFMSCAKKNPEKTIECEKKYVAKSKAAADAAGKTMKGLKGDDAASEYQAFMAEYAGVFGAGQEQDVAGFGPLQQQPGAVAKFKYQLLQEMAQKQQAAMQQQQMAAMQAQMRGMMGGAGMAAMASPMAAASGGMLGLGIK